MLQSPDVMYNVIIQNNLSRFFTSTDLSPPTVRIFEPTRSDLSTSDVLTLLCLVSGFFPSNLILHWEKNGQKLNSIYHSTSDPWKYEESSTYSLSSRLNISKTEDGGSLYSCVVAHESSDVPFKSSFKDVLGKHSLLHHHCVFGTEIQVYVDECSPVQNELMKDLGLTFFDISFFYIKVHLKEVQIKI